MRTLILAIGCAIAAESAIAAFDSLGANKSLLAVRCGATNVVCCNADLTQSATGNQLHCRNANFILAKGLDSRNVFNACKERYAVQSFEGNRSRARFFFCRGGKNIFVLLNTETEPPSLGDD